VNPYRAAPKEPAFRGPLARGTPHATFTSHLALDEIEHILIEQNADRSQWVMWRCHSRDAASDFVKQVERRRQLTNLAF
jgi:hypothetical protein